MPKVLSLTGKKFGRLIVIQRSTNSKQGSSRWLCKCSCGKEKTILGYSITGGHTKSCGCLHRESVRVMGLNNVKHGHKRRSEKSRTYGSWRNMRERCTNHKHQAYEDYGGRRITVCDRWLESFSNFLEDMGEQPPNTSINRIDNDKGYYLENCCWATRQEQQRNKRNNHLETYENKTQCVTAWAEEFGIPPHIVLWRLKNGWSIGRAITTPPRRYFKRNQCDET